MTTQPDRKEERSREERDQVNPAARRDRPGEARPPTQQPGRRDQQVHPEQEEPLDPLGPGGIGG